MKISKISSERVPMNLLLEADPSESSIKKYLDQSYCFVAEDSGRFVGIYVLFPLKSSAWELMNIAVSPDMQGKGIGTKLLQHALDSAKKLGAKRLELGTGTFGFQLRFYQKAGFRVYAVERDYFLDHYDEPLFEAGIQHKDRLRLAINF